MKHIYIEIKRGELQQLLDEAQDQLNTDDLTAFSCTLGKARSGLEDINFYKAHGRAPMDLLEVARWKSDEMRKLMSTR